MYMRARQPDLLWLLLLMAALSMMVMTAGQTLAKGIRRSQFPQSSFRLAGRKGVTIAVRYTTVRRQRKTDHRTYSHAQRTPYVQWTIYGELWKRAQPEIVKQTNTTSGYRASLAIKALVAPLNQFQDNLKPMLEEGRRMSKVDLGRIIAQGQGLARFVV